MFVREKLPDGLQGRPGKRGMDEELDEELVCPVCVLFPFSPLLSPHHLPSSQWSRSSLKQTHRDHRFKTSIEGERMNPKEASCYY